MKTELIRGPKKKIVIPSIFVQLLVFLCCVTWSKHSSSAMERVTDRNEQFGAGFTQLGGLNDAPDIFLQYHFSSLYAGQLGFALRSQKDVALTRFWLSLRREMIVEPRLSAFLKTRLRIESRDIESKNNQMLGLGLLGGTQFFPTESDHFALIFEVGLEFVDQRPSGGYIRSMGGLSELGLLIYF